MEPIEEWLQTLGLSQYGPAFIAADIDPSVLPDLTEADLERLGVTLGHRKKLLRAIAALSEGVTQAPPAPAAGAAREAERRQVTVVFCDLVGSTAPSARLDPEDLREVIGRYHACVAETVSRFDGFVAKYMGDGVLVYFGYPHAHEDDAEQVVRAGLALVNAVGELAAPGRLQLRIGIATGLVIVGDLLGAGSAQEQAVVGETPNLAARLQGLAEPGAVLIDARTRRLVGNLFEYGDLGAIEIKGFEGRQRAWRILGKSGVLSRFEALRSHESPFVGREEEMELLRRRWASARAGEGEVVLISGEAGIGKSRLVAATLERLAAEPHTRVRYFCSPHYADSALYPIISQLEYAAGFEPGELPQSRLDKLDALLSPVATSAADRALLAELLSLPVGDRRFP